MPRRTIKKYANRRLYDVETSRYITQAELRELIADGADVQVVDARTGQDRTREVLLQIVAEQEQLGVPILSDTMLLALIRFYGNPLQQMASRYLEASLGNLVAQSGDVAERLRRATLSPAEFMNRMAQGGLDWLEQWQESLRETHPGREEAAPGRSSRRKKKGSE
jgi:polyhydroxyalkanoate synthesis repressor PhaR